MPRIKATQWTAAPNVDPDPLSGHEEWMNPKASQAARRASKARQLSGRRRRVDPATCDRDYSEAEMEFMQAIQEYKTRSGRLFPTWSEVLEVLHGLGYVKTCHEQSGSNASAPF